MTSRSHDQMVKREGLYMTSRLHDQMVKREGL